MEALKNISWAPIARILLRYGIGMFTAYAWITPEVGEELVRDPDMQVMVETMLGAVAAAMVEGAYLMARRWDWST